MTIQQLKYVVALSNSISMREASGKLYITQAALSATVRDLEEELGSFEEEEDDNNNNEEDLSENYDDEEENENNDLFADVNDYKNQIEQNLEIAEEDQNDDEDFMNKKPKKKFKRK